MAKAPKPGSTPTARKTKPQGPRGFRIILDDKPADIYPDDVGPRDSALVRHETNKALGFPVTLVDTIATLDNAGAQMDVDVLCILWWWGRRKAGLHNISLATAFGMFPALHELEGRLVFEAIEPDDPDEGVDADPLPSGDDSPTSSPA